ncbi:hypothetical protein GCM10010917_29300 [Paenibacillus physcomitrellae]|uniref:Uncharacterized protein n=1 Tax=Paenibacillus physcomitrellae TaxID=1619311 RepID=A0ABQ1GEJ5_9BACL|nr:hypothetical protein GCM10010917_29300 [Paenibacillus physcomitrellae]
MLQQVEEGMVAHFIEEHIPEEFKSIFRRQLREGKDDSVESRILEVADKLDQIYEAFAELQRGNTEKEFVLMYRAPLIKIKGIKLPSLTVDLNRKKPASVGWFLNMIAER